MTGDPIRDRQEKTQRHKGKGHVNGARDMSLCCHKPKKKKTQNHQEQAEAERGKKKFSPRAFERNMAQLAP